MAVGQVTICNAALTLLGKPTITSLNDPTDRARTLNVQYDIVRRAILSGRTKWLFSIKRTSLGASAEAPVSGPFVTQYPLPADFLAPVQVGPFWAGLDLSDYRLGPTDADFSIEGSMILCDYGAPLDLSYVWDVTDTNLFHPWFVLWFGAMLAYMCAEKLQGSDAKKAEAKANAREFLTEAAAANCLAKPPQILADDTWIAARLQ
jgi:hypothetical protein